VDGWSKSFWIRSIGHITEHHSVDLDAENREMVL